MTLCNMGRSIVLPNIYNSEPTEHTELEDTEHVVTMIVRLIGGIIEAISKASYVHQQGCGLERRDAPGAAQAPVARAQNESELHRSSPQIRMILFSGTWKDGDEKPGRLHHWPGARKRHWEGRDKGLR